MIKARGRMRSACPIKVSEIWVKCWEVTAVIVNYIALFVKLTWKIEFWIITNCWGNGFLYKHQLLPFLSKMHRNRCRLGLRPRPRWGAYSAPPDPLAVWGRDREFFELCTPSRNPGYAPENISNYSNSIINMVSMRRESIADVHKNVIISLS